LGDRLDLPSQDPARAVELANRVVELQPKDWRRWRTLGIVRYRAGEWKGAVSALEKAQQLLEDDEIARLFLAMAHWRAGNREQARVCYGHARDLAKATKTPGGDLSRYRAEAADLIGGIDRPVPNTKGAQPPEK
jgi:Flp pilus assembly protein TadD